MEEDEKSKITKSNVATFDPYWTIFIIKQFWQRAERVLEPRQSAGESRQERF